MSLFATPNVVVPSNKTTNYTVSATDDLVPFLITTAANATLPASSGLFSGLVSANRTGGQGIVYIQNLATSTANVTLVAASGDVIFGGTIVSPGQILEARSDGMGSWYTNSFGGAGAGVSSAVVPLSSAQILALNATPVALVAAPGTGKAIKVLNIGFKMTTTATAYANGGALEFRYTDGSGTKVTADIAAAVVTAGAGTSYTNVMGIEASLTMTVNAQINVNNATAPFITGTGSALVFVLYTIVG